MRLEYVRHLSGPNVFTTAPVSIARVELDDLTCRETTDYPGFAERLTLALPGLRDHHCAAGRPGGFTDAMTRGTYFGHVAEHVALELSGLAGREVHLGRTMWAGADGRYDVMTECPQDEPEDSAVPSELYQLAITVVHDLLAKRRPDFTGHLEAIARTVERERLGPSTAAIAEAARSRGIPVRRVGGLSMLRLGYGCHRRLVSAAMTEQTSAIGVDIAGDKMLAKQFLARAGIPVPERHRRAHRGRVGPGTRRARRARGDQAAERQPRPVRHRRRPDRGRGRAGLPARGRRVRLLRGDRRELRARQGLPRARRGRPGQRGRRAQAAVGDGGRQPHDRRAHRRPQRRPAPGSRALASAHQGHGGRRDARAPCRRRPAARDRCRPAASR